MPINDAGHDQSKATARIHLLVDLSLAADIFVSVVAVPFGAILIMNNPPQRAGRWAMLAGGVSMCMGLVAQHTPVIVDYWLPPPFATLGSVGAGLAGLVAGACVPGPSKTTGEPQ